MTVNKSGGSLKRGTLVVGKLGGERISNKVGGFVADWSAFTVLGPLKRKKNEQSSDAIQAGNREEKRGPLTMLGTRPSVICVSSKGPVREKRGP